MTIRDDLPALIDELDETDAYEALAFLKARLELDSRVSQTYIAECEAAYDEAHAADAVLVPHETVQRWLEAWGTPGETDADREIEQLEEKPADEPRARTTE